MSTVYQRPISSLLFIDRRRSIDGLLFLEDLWQAFCRQNTCSRSLEDQQQVFCLQKSCERPSVHRKSSYDIPSIKYLQRDFLQCIKDSRGTSAYRTNVEDLFCLQKTIRRSSAYRTSFVCHLSLFLSVLDIYGPEHLEQYS